MVDDELVRNRMHGEPVAVAWYDSAEAAYTRMQAAGLDAIPVVNEDRVIGILERSAANACEKRGNWLGAVPVADLMRRGAFWCRSDDTLSKALATMDRHEADLLAVLDESGVLVGTLGRSHVLSAQRLALSAAAAR